MRQPPAEGGRSPTGAGGCRKEFFSPRFAGRWTPPGGRGGPGHQLAIRLESRRARCRVIMSLTTR